MKRDYAALIAVFVFVTIMVVFAWLVAEGTL